eukprot:m.354093 g.354093  ORF g.354093 m.354093 type:complete len:84 (+) comp16916_c0_seq1:199-450(+)
MQLCNVEECDHSKDAQAEAHNKQNRVNETDERKYTIRRVTDVRDRHQSIKPLGCTDCTQDNMPRVFLSTNSRRSSSSPCWPHG